MIWTEQLENGLRNMWEQGFSASQIAAQLGGGCTRNSIIGKVHRLGLPPRREREKARVARAVPAAARVVRIVPKEAHVVPTEARIVRRQGSVTIMELDNFTCRWPLDDGMYCGKIVTLDGRPYCQHHCSVAYHEPKWRNR